MATGTVTVVHVRSRVPGAIFIGRPSVFGNPYVIGRDGDRAEVIEKYREWLLRKVATRRAEGQELWKDLLKLAIRLHHGEHLHLACFCAPLPCHGDLIREAILTLSEKILHEGSLSPLVERF